MGATHDWHSSLDCANACTAEYLGNCPMPPLCRHGLDNHSLEDQQQSGFTDRVHLTTHQSQNSSVRVHCALSAKAFVHCKDGQLTDDKAGTVCQSSVERPSDDVPYLVKPPNVDTQAGSRAGPPLVSVEMKPLLAIMLPASWF